jgi:hypothetical protein
MLNLTNAYSNGQLNNLINLMHQNYNNNQLNLMQNVRIYGKNN